MVSAHTSIYAEPLATDVMRWRQITPLLVQRRLPTEEAGDTPLWVSIQGYEGCPVSLKAANI
jgi:hypothetical protein